MPAELAHSDPQRIVPSVCEACAHDFMARPGRGRYCSVLCSQAHRRGVNHYNYKGGLAFDKQQRRWRIMCRDGSEQLFARAVMESTLGRPLLSSELVHHVNEDTEDDRLENLRLTTRQEHPTLHRRIR